jgi:hypothetical protein
MGECTISVHPSIPLSLFPHEFKHRALAAESVVLHAQCATYIHSYNTYIHTDIHTSYIRAGGVGLVPIGDALAAVVGVASHALAIVVNEPDADGALR